MPLNDYLKTILAVICRKLIEAGVGFRLKSYISSRIKSSIKAKLYRGIAGQRAKVDDSTQRAESLSFMPLISILVPTFNTDPSLLEDTVHSVIDQSYTSWELCICDDGSKNVQTITMLKSLQTRDSRVKVMFLENNYGISHATNHALSIAKGEFIALLDHDDLLTVHALYEVVKAINTNPDIDVIYSDQDKIDSLNRESEPFYKPQWSPELFRGVMYIGHLLVVRRSIAERAGRFNPEFDKVQDYEFMLRVSEITNNIMHIPKILYHWRVTPGSLAYGMDEKADVDKLQALAVNRHFERLGISATASPHPCFRHRTQVHPGSRRNYPLISIVIPTRNAPEHIGRCLQSIYEKTTYRNYEVVIVDNNTTDPAAKGILRQYPCTVLNYNETFNFSKANNLGIGKSRGEILILLNNDTEVITEDWLESLLFYLEQPNVGAVGPLLVYPDYTVQHAGVVLGFRGTADHVMRGFPADSDGYAGSLSCAREVSAVTAACLAIRKSTYFDAGGLCEYFATHYQDVDLCLRLRSMNKRILFNPNAILIHHESVSRKTFYDHMDRALLLDNWKNTINKGDPYYNRNFSLSHVDYTVHSG